MIVLPAECISRTKEDWVKWLDTHTNHSPGEEDFGLARIAKQLGDKQTNAVMCYWEGAARESEGDVDEAIKLYRKAYKMWPALDSLIQGGIPRNVREEAKVAGILDGLLGVVDVSAAQATRVHKAPNLLSSQDLSDIAALQHDISSLESSLENNPENNTHQLKIATFMNNPPHFHMVTQLPCIVGKMIAFAEEAWKVDLWHGTNEHIGPLSEVPGGVPSLSVRVVEHWEYEVGGGLQDDYHHDTDSVLTIVVLLSDASDFEGGTFRTFECDGTHMEHTMDQGDAICFISHKYHNIVPLTRGKRRSLVMELWQGGVGHKGR